VTGVELKALGGSAAAGFPDERIPAIVVDSFPALGMLTAVRFIEWAQKNPEGTVSLPTGKTPEHFIREVGRLIRGWDDREVRNELEKRGIDPSVKCVLGGLRFVQIDEFYPINPLHTNSFRSYVTRFYIEGFGLDPGRAMLIDASSIGLPAGRGLEDVWPEGEVDLSLRLRFPNSSKEAEQKRVLEAVDQWCCEHEERIRRLGGIGFFLGGIGPDGHIGFNVRGSDLHSTTRLTSVNYETQAAAASDLGGIEIARKRLVITIGLATITFNPQCVAIVLAAGEARAGIVAASLGSPPHIRYPASALQGLPNARFYLTQGAAALLAGRQLAAFAKKASASPEEIDRAVITLALAKGRTIEVLSESDFMADPTCAEVLKKTGAKPADLAHGTAERMREKIRAGSESRASGTFLHTEPHHDDLMLGYLPFIVRHIRQHGTRHFFATLTSGFTAVTNAYMLKQLIKLKRFMAGVAFRELALQGYFDPASQPLRNRDVWQYLDGVAAESRTLKDDGEMRRFYRNLAELSRGQGGEAPSGRVDELIEYFKTRYPGQKDIDEVQRLKGMCREWEADCLWGYFGWSGESVRHLRLGFYTGDIFTEQPTADRDVPPVLQLLRAVKPDVVTVALDPEASGPDTHYKVLQTVTEALRRYRDETGRNDIEVLGYRNVWFRFNPADVELYVPVSLNMFSLQQSAFMNTFISQKDASFPSHEHDGPFHELAQKIQVEQYRMVKTCLGAEYFDAHPSALIRATRGFVFLKRMSLDGLFERSGALRKATEAEK
jgi:glucosamine-6-phosphate deaminase